MIMSVPILPIKLWNQLRMFCSLPQAIPIFFFILTSRVLHSIYTVHPDPQVHTGGHPDTQVHTGVHPDTLVHTGVHPDTQVHTGVHPDTQVHTGVHPDTQVHTGVHPDTQVHTGVHPDTQVHTMGGSRTKNRVVPTCVYVLYMPIYGSNIRSFRANYNNIK